MLRPRNACQPIAESPTTVDFTKRRRVRSRTGSRLMVRRRADAVSNQETARLVRDRSYYECSLRLGPLLRPVLARRGAAGLAEQLGELFGDGAAELFSVTMVTARR